MSHFASRLRTNKLGLTFDKSVGNGVDSAGFASLPLRAGAVRYYVNASTGSDSNTSTQAQNPATPVATINKALSFVTSGNGDQVLVAQGTSYSAGLSTMSGMGGFSPVYPTVIQSYDPADPTNEAKLGRASGSNRPILTATLHSLLQGSGTSQKYFAFRGLDFNSGSGTQLASISMLPNTFGTPDYILFENCKFQYIQLSLDNGNSANYAKATHFIIRNSSFHEQYGDHSQGCYLANIDGITIEDCAFWACGRLSTASRDAAQSSGGASIFNHPIYMQSDILNAIVRRCVFIDTATDGGILKGGGTYQQNLVIRCPISFALGGGDNYSQLAPQGSNIECSYNAAIGSNIVNSTSGAIGWGASTVNGRQNYANVHHNVVARNDQALGSSYAWTAKADTDNSGVALPNYTVFHHNVSYLWNTSGQSTQFPTTALNFPTATNNVWDDPTGGTNTNVGSVTFNNAYTETSLLSALGYTSETAAINDWVANPEQHGWRLGVKLMLQGYNVDISQMPFLG